MRRRARSGRRRAHIAARACPRAARIAGNAVSMSTASAATNRDRLFMGCWQSIGTVCRVRLGIDFGTSNTVAVLRTDDGEVRPLLFDGSPSLPSAVCRQADGLLLVGRDAIHTARRYPEAFEPHPKRLVDERTALLGPAEVPVTHIISAVLRRVADEAVRVGGGEPSTVVLTHPVTWAGLRRGVLQTAAATAGLDRTRLVPEPVAAAHYFVRHSHVVPVGSTVVVFDFGAGTFDASVLRRTADGFAVLASDGRTDTGGLDIDAAIVAQLGRVCAGRDPAAWARLTAPTTVDDRQAARRLWDDVRSAKEILSRAATTFVPVPILGVDVPLGRPQFENLVRPILERAVDVTARAIRSAGVEDPAAVFLVGGSSRIPLVATLLHRRFGVAPIAVEQPELVVAQGSVVDDGQPTVPLPLVGSVPALSPARPADDNEPVTGQPASRRLSRRALVTTAVLGGGVALAAAGGIAYSQLREKPVEYVHRGRLDGSAHGVEVIAFHPTFAGTLVVGGSDGLVRKFGTTELKQYGEPLTGHTGKVTALAYDPGGRVLASADSAGLVQLWDAIGSSASPVGILRYGDGVAVNTLTFTPDGRELVAAGDDGMIRFWDVLTRAPKRKPLDSRTEGVMRLAFSPVSLVLAALYRDGRGVAFWEIADSLEFGGVGGHEGRVQAMAWHPADRTLATASDDSTVRLWDASGRRTKGDPMQHGRGSLIDDVLFTPDGRTVISVVDNKRVMFWDTRTHDKAGGGIPVSARRLALNGDGSLLAAASTSDVNFYSITRRT
jgi:WD40 repeat protein/Ethanolamine utilization protein EutJ (predicted chaperonin)